MTHASGGAPGTPPGRTRWSALAALAALVLAGAGGCGEDGSGPAANELIGIWGAVTYEYTGRQDPSLRYDLIEEGGTYSIELVVDGSYRWNLNTLAGTTTGSGSYVVGDGRLTLSPAGGGDPEVYRLSFNEIFLTLTNEDAAWDFDGDGVAEPAQLHMVLDRF